MIGIFRRADKPVLADAAALGHTMLALALPATCAVPPGCVGLIVDAGGRTRRLAPGSRATLADGERVSCFHPGPYTADLLPFAAAPELGLRLSYAIDGPDPRVHQQRFDLYLASETDGQLGAATLAVAIEAALQRELAQGNLDLPPCTTLDEWNAFRAGLNQLLYMRFGLTVDDCLPVDLGDTVDYAQLLLARAADAAIAADAAKGADAVIAADAAAADGASGAIVASAGAPLAQGAVTRNGTVLAAAGTRCSDAAALRRLFLELPCVMSALRLAVLPPGQAMFRAHHALLQRLDLACLAVTTMPALDLSAPGAPLDAAQQARRSAHSLLAAGALDEAWALLARLRLAPAAQLEVLFDEADRIVANLEAALAARRVAIAETEAA